MVKTNLWRAMLDLPARSVAAPAGIAISIGPVMVRAIRTSKKYVESDWRAILDMLMPVPRRELVSTSSKLSRNPVTDSENVTVKPIPPLMSTVDTILLFAMPFAMTGELIVNEVMVGCTLSNVNV